jgi:hypothetical protein
MEENATTGELELREEGAEAGTEGGKVIVDNTLKLLGGRSIGERDAAMRQIAEYMDSIQ